VASAAPAATNGLSGDTSKPSIPPLTFTLNAPRPTVGTALSAVPHGGGGSERRIPAGYVHGGVDNSGEVMRLTALLEDTRIKLDRAHTKLTASETSVCRANNALLSERATANARVAQMAAENKALKEQEVSLRTELKNTPSATQTLHDAEMFRIQAEGAVKMEEENEGLRRSLDRRVKELHAAKETMKSLSIEHDALRTSYDQVSASLGEAFANHSVEVEALKKEVQATGARAPREDTAALAACQQAADSRLAAELAAMEQSSKKATELAVKAAAKGAAKASRSEMRVEMEAKLEATEKRNAVAEKKLYSQLERAFEDRDAAVSLAEKHETRARLAEEFVASTTLSTNAPDAEPAAVTAAALAVDEDNQCALSRYDQLRATHAMHARALAQDPHSVRKQMRTAAVARQCREMGDAMILGKTVTKRHATADVDTGLGCCSQRSAIKGGGDMKTKAYATCAVPYVSEDMGGEHIMQTVHSGNLESDLTSTSGKSGAASNSAKQQMRISALIGATKQDLTKSLQFHTLVHQLNAGTIQVVRVDATGNSTACAAYAEGNEELQEIQEEGGEDGEEERDLITL
jgi:hypothetical protein